MPVFGDDSIRAVLKRTAPSYPPLARQMHLSGAVVLTASVEPDGHVSKVTVVSGHPLFWDAAKDALRQWKYAPGPDQTETTVRLVFDPH